MDCKTILDVVPACSSGTTITRGADVLLIVGTAPGWHGALDATLARLDAARVPVEIMALNTAIAEIDMPFEHAVSVHPNILPGFLSQCACKPLVHGPALSHGIQVAWVSPVSLGGSAHLGIVAGLGMGYSRIILVGICIDTGTPYAPMQRYFWRDVEHFAGRVRAVSPGWMRKILGAPDAEWLEGAGA